MIDRSSCAHCVTGPDMSGCTGECWRGHASGSIDMDFTATPNFIDSVVKTFEVEAQNFKLADTDGNALMTGTLIPHNLSNEKKVEAARKLLEGTPYTIAERGEFGGPKV